MDNNYYINHRTICQIPEEILTELVLAEQKPDYKKVIEESIEELQKRRNKYYKWSFLKWREELSEEEKEAVLNVFSSYDISDKNVLTFVVDRDGDVCLFTKDTLYLGKNKKYEVHYYTIPLDRIRACESKQTVSEALFIITIEDDNKIVMKESEFSMIPKEFLEIYTENLLSVKNEIERKRRIVQESKDVKKRIHCIDYAIDKVNEKYDKKLIVKTNELDEDSLAWMYIQGDKKIIFTKHAILLHDVFGQTDINLREVSEIKMNRGYSFWFMLKYKNGSEKEFTFGVEKTKIMHDFFLFYLEEYQAKQ